MRLSESLNLSNGFNAIPLEELICPEGFSCSCGKNHAAGIRILKLGPGVIGQLPDILQILGARRPMVVCGPYGYEAAGKAVCDLLEQSGVEYSLRSLREEDGERIKPSEYAAGSLLLRFDHRCDLILGVGSGVINDLCKVLSKTAKLPYLIVATAPSMDGYTSDSASVEVGGIKRSLQEKKPDAILCDTQILSQAPLHMILAGLGDILAKYTALFDWKLSHIVTGEYYCEAVAKLFENSLERTLDNLETFQTDRERTVRSITEGLIRSGIGIAFAGCTHPASGLEHYFSHCWEMMLLERGKDYELHGIQVGIGLLLTLKIIDYLKTLQPNMAHAEAAADCFDRNAWEQNLRRVFPKAADGILEIEQKAHKNDREARLQRAATAIEHWAEIISLADTLPSYEEAEAIMRQTGMPTDPLQIGLTAEDVTDAFICSRDIRNKYLLSSLIWDLGYMDEAAAMLSGTFRE